MRQRHARQLVIVVNGQPELDNGLARWLVKTVGGGSDGGDGHGKSRESGSYRLSGSSRRAAQYGTGIRKFGFSTVLEQ